MRYDLAELLFFGGVTFVVGYFIGRVHEGVRQLRRWG